MNWSKSSKRKSPGYLDFDAGPPLPPRNQLSNSRAIRLSDSADLLYEVPQEFTNSVSHSYNLGLTSSSQSHYDHNPVYATVQRKTYRHHHQPSDLTRSDSHSTGWSTYSGGDYATMTWKRAPPPKPPRKATTPLNRSLSQQQYHSKSQHQLHIQSSRAFGYEFVPISSAGESLITGGSGGVGGGGGDVMKRSASNDGDGLYAELKHAPNSTSSSSRFSTFLGSSPSPNSASNNATNAQATTENIRHNYDQHSLMTDSAFSSLYDEIANGCSSSNSSTLPHPRSAGQSGRGGSIESHAVCKNHVGSNGINNHSNDKGSTSLTRKDRAPSLHQRSKSEHHPEHHPLCPNFHLHPQLPPRPPLPPKPVASSQSSRPNSGSNKRDNGFEPPLPARNNVSKHQNGTYESTYDEIKPVVVAVDATDIYPERPPSPETAVDGIRSVIKPLSKGYKLAKSMHRDMQTFVEEDLFSSFDSTGKMVQIRLRKAPGRPSVEDKLIETDATLENPLDVRLRENHNSSTLPRVSTTNRLSKASIGIEDGKKSLRRTKHHATDWTGTAERRRKKSLSKAGKSQHDATDHVSKDMLEPALVIKPIEIDIECPSSSSSLPNNNTSEGYDSSGKSEISTVNGSQPVKVETVVSNGESLDLRSSDSKTHTAKEPATTAPTTSTTAATSDTNNANGEKSTVSAPSDELPKRNSPAPGGANRTKSPGPSGANRTKSPLIPFDANNEWAEIEKILESFGSDLCASNTFSLDDLEKQFTEELNKASNPDSTQRSESRQSGDKPKPAVKPKPRVEKPRLAEKPALHSRAHQPPTSR